MQGHAPFWIDPRDASCAFPDVSLALREPDGLLAIGGDLAPQRLLAAYRHGIFPWYNEDQPILWWSPDPRTVLFPDRVIVARRLRRTLRQQRFRLTLDTAFTQVIEACSGPRARAHGTWISTEMKQAYSLLHDLGHAHSVECWQDERLVGGMYGVAVGRVFFGESMFSHARDASKVALVTLLAQLARWGFGLLDCQVHSTHLASLGAEGIPRARFMQLLDQYCEQPFASGRWRFEHLDEIVSSL